MITATVFMKKTHYKHHNNGLKTNITVFQGASLRANYVGGKRKPRIHLLYNAVNSYLSLCTEKVTILE